VSVLAPRDVWISGIGLVSSLGDGPKDHWTRLNSPASLELHTKKRYGHFVCPLASVDFTRHIPNRLDIKRWGTVQSAGVHAAGNALVDAGLKDATEILTRTIVIAAASGGERDVGLDHSMFADPTRFEDSGEFNHKIVASTRPSLFLAQLPNLLAGNISITFGIAGGSRTLIGEELAGVNALLIAHHLVSEGAYDVALAGGSFVGDRADALLLYGFGGFLWHGGPVPVGARSNAGGGLILGSMSAFLVLESEDHVRARNVDPICRLSAIKAGHSRRNPGDVTLAINAQWDGSARSGVTAVISGASGVAPICDEELVALAGLQSAVRMPGSLTGHGMEASFPFNVALACLAHRHGTFYPPFPGDSPEPRPYQPLGRVVVTGVGHWRGEGLAVVDSRHALRTDR
jgi:3-oxoacyl-[acyl-carrier-protein] synthase II